MKKQVKKLVLAKETLRNLELENLDSVVGATIYTGPTNCNGARQRVSCEGC
jgi:hypothetical protein